MKVNLDRRIRIEQKTVSQDATYGTDVVTWAPFAAVYAEMVDVVPSRSESVRQGLEMARNQVRCRMRYLSGLDSAMRVRWDGLTYNIVGGPAELGRREWHEIVLERYSS